MDKKYIFLRALVMLVLLLCAAMSFAQTNLPNVVDTAPNSLPLTQTAPSNLGSLPAIPGLPALTVKTNADGTQEYTVTLQILAIMTALTFLPALLMMMTSFTRIIIVFSILRQALGLQQSPSNQILTGMALFLTLFIMAPVFDRVNQDALQPYLAETLTAQDAVAKAQVPIKDF